MILNQTAEREPMIGPAAGTHKRPGKKKAKQSKERKKRAGRADKRSAHVEQPEGGGGKERGGERRTEMNHYRTDRHRAARGSLDWQGHRARHHERACEPRMSACDRDLCDHEKHRP